MLLLGQYPSPGEAGATPEGARWRGQPGLLPYRVMEPRPAMAQQLPGPMKTLHGRWGARGEGHEGQGPPKVTSPAGGMEPGRDRKRSLWEGGLWRVPGPHTLSCFPFQSPAPHGMPGSLQPCPHCPACSVSKALSQEPRSGPCSVPPLSSPVKWATCRVTVGNCRRWWGLGSC